MMTAQKLSILRLFLRSATLIVVVLLVFSQAGSVSAHHSFAIYDFEVTQEFEGVVEIIKFRNPHIEMILKVTHPDGSEDLIHYVEGAPANMLVRNGVTPDKMKVGSRLKTTASPLLEDPKKYFLRALITEDGTEYGI
jgi:hypothetical protein